MTIRQGNAYSYCLNSSIYQTMESGLSASETASVAMLGHLTDANMTMTNLGQLTNLSDEINLNLNMSMAMGMNMDPGGMEPTNTTEFVKLDAPDIVQTQPLDVEDKLPLNLPQPTATLEESKLQVQKRRRSVLTLQQKLEVIERIKKGEKVTKLAAEYGVGKATVSDLKRQEDKITAFVSKMTSASTQKRKTMRKPQDERVEKALHMWLSREKKKGTQISGPLLMEKAKAFHKQLYGEDNDKFKASTGWLHRFKLRNGIKHQKPTKRKPSADAESDANAVQIHLDGLRSFIRDNCLAPDQIYTADKTRLLWRALPFKMSHKNSHRVPKDGVVVLGCSNATGNHKLRLAMIGKQKSLWGAGSANVGKMPFRYYNQDDGWMDAEIFGEWFHHEFVTAVRAYYEGAGQPARAVLLVDDMPPQPEGGSVQVLLHSDDNNIQCMSVPSITAFITQPINVHLFEIIKRNYRKKLVFRALAVHPGKGPPSRLSDLSKWISLKDVGYMLSEVWGAVSSESIRKLWRDTLYCLGAVDEQAVVVDELLKKVDEGEPENGTLVEDAFDIVGLLKEYDENLNENDVASWLSMDVDKMDTQTWSMSDNDIVETVLREVTGTDSEEDECSSNGMSSRSESRTDASKARVPSDSEAYTCFTKCLSWLESQPDCEPSYLQLLWKLQNMAAQKKKAKR